MLVFVWLSGLQLPQVGKLCRSLMHFQQALGDTVCWQLQVC
jgi:hypothetical protein